MNVHLKPPSVPKQQNGRSHKSDELKVHRLSPGVQETLRGWFLMPQNAQWVMDVTYWQGVSGFSCTAGCLNAVCAVCADGAAAMS